MAPAGDKDAVPLDRFRDPGRQRAPQLFQRVQWIDVLVDTETWAG